MPPKQRLYIHVVALILIILAFTAFHGLQFSTNLTQTHWEDELFFSHSAQNVHSIIDCFRAESVWPGLYRPLTTNCYYYFGRETFNNRMEIYHAINAIMVCINGWLLYLLSQRLLWQGGLLQGVPSEQTRIFALLTIIPGLLFVTRYAHIEVVLNTVEFQALFYVFAGLLTLILVTGFPSAEQRDEKYRTKLFGGSLCLFVALLSKEAAISVGAIWIVMLLLLQRSARGPIFLVPLMISSIWMGLFVWIFRKFGQYQPTGFSYLPTFDNILTNYGAYFFSFFNLVSANGDSTMPERAIELALSPWGRGITLFLLLVSTSVLVYLAIQSVLRLINYRRAASTSLLRQSNQVDGSVRALLAKYTLFIGFSITFFFLATAPFVLFEDRLFARYGYLGHAGIAMAIGFMLISIVMLLQRAWSQTS